MNDRFKFRVWSKKYNKFIEDNRYPIGSDFQLIITQGGTLIKLGLGDFEDDCEDSYSWATFDNYEQDCIVMQCTGLKDKNGKLIYEGDIVNYDDRDLDYWHTPILNAVIEMRKYQWCMVYYRKDIINVDTRKPAEQKTCLGFDDFISSRIEVIGNIYENKDLLNENS